MMSEPYILNSSLRIRLPLRSEPAQVSDVELLQAIARRDELALGLLFDRYRLILFGLLVRILNSRPEAEDILQEVFLQVWRRAADFDEQRGRPFTWLVTLARSRAIDRLRARRARPHGPSDERAAGNIVDTGPLVDAQVLSAEQIDRLRAALDELPVLQRAAIELAYFEGFTHAKIAERLEQPLGTVKTRIRLALIKLRDVLAGTV